MQFPIATPDGRDHETALRHDPGTVQDIQRRLTKLTHEFKCWPVPPADLRTRVSGDPDRDKFLGIGQTVFADLKRLALLGGKPFDQARCICDFGCGAGRVTRFVVPADAAVVGIDIDPDAIAWCTEALGEFGTFIVGPHRPPVDLPDGSFDLIIAVSVFTHLPENLAEHWRAELDRLLSRDGVLIATFLSESVLEHVMPEGAAAMATEGVYYSAKYPTPGLPSFYGLAFHRADYVQQIWSQRFELAGYHGKAIAGFQDALVCRKRSGEDR